jgi:hypothetical protein
MESSAHIYLVELLERWVQKERSYSLDFLLVDRSTEHPQSRPIRIGQYIPDLYLKDLRLNETIIGEAKTTKDLRTLHTRDQLQEFMTYLDWCNGLMLLAVELSDRTTGRALVSKIARDHKLSQLSYKVITPSDLR